MLREKITKLLFELLKKFHDRFQCPWLCSQKILTNANPGILFLKKKITFLLIILQNIICYSNCMEKVLTNTDTIATLNKLLKETLKDTKQSRKCPIMVRLETVTLLGSGSE